MIKFAVVASLFTIQTSLAATCAPGESPRPLTPVEVTRLEAKRGWSRVLLAELEKDKFLADPNAAELGGLTAIMVPLGLAGYTATVARRDVRDFRAWRQKRGALRARAAAPVAGSGAQANAGLIARHNAVRELAGPGGRVRLSRFGRGLKLAFLTGLTAIVAVEGARTIMHILGYFKDPAKLDGQRADLRREIDAMDEILARNQTCAE